MPKRLPMFYSALLLTAVNLLLRLVGTSFQVFLSGRIGPEGIGLLQLVLSVGSLSMVAGIAGVRTATMYLTAEQLGRKHPENVTRTLSACFLYSILCSCGAGAALYLAAPKLAQSWIGNAETAPALRLLAAFLPLNCLCSVMTGYFTAANRIGTLAAVEVAEQLCSMGITMVALTVWGGENSVRACLSVILGSNLGGCLTLGCLIFLRIRERAGMGEAFPIGGRLVQAAAPLAMADVLRSGIITAENLMVPKRLADNPAIANPLASFGIVSGMVFPILMFPSCILYGLAELLIPELARCAAAGSKQRISYLVRRSLKVAMLYGFAFSGLLYLLSRPLCLRFYGNGEAALALRRYAPLVPMLYCDAITDAMTKGLGQQRVCVRYNILTSAMDVALLYLLLPKFGMDGYFFSFFVTHALNFALSLRRLLILTGEHIPLSIPTLTLAAAILALWIVRFIASPTLQCLLFLVVLICLLTLFRVLGKGDWLWVLGLIRNQTGRKNGARLEA